MAGSSGIVEVHSHISTAYIEKVVYRTGMAEAAIVQRSLDQGTRTLANVQLGLAGSSSDHVGGVDPTVPLAARPKQRSQLHNAEQ